MELGQTRRFFFLVLAFLPLALTYPLSASASASAQNEAGSPQNQQHTNDTQAARPFEGKVTKAADNAGRFVLQESSTGQSYSLDDQKAVKQYAGKNVKVIATIDPVTNTLHVVDIRPATEK